LKEIARVMRFHHKMKPIPPPKEPTAKNLIETSRAALQRLETLKKHPRVHVPKWILDDLKAEIEQMEKELREEDLDEHGLH